MQKTLLLNTVKRQFILQMSLLLILFVITLIATVFINKLVEFRMILAFIIGLSFFFNTTELLFQVSLTRQNSTTILIKARLIVALLFSMLYFLFLFIVKQWHLPTESFRGLDFLVVTCQFMICGLFGLAAESSYKIFGAAGYVLTGLFAQRYLTRLFDSGYFNVTEALLHFVPLLLLALFSYWLAKKSIQTTDYTQ